MKKLFLIFIPILFMAGCGDSFTPVDGDVAGAGNLAQGNVRIYIGKEEANERTLQPDHNNIEGYQLTFEHYISESPLYNDSNYVAGRKILTTNNWLNNEYLSTSNDYQLYIESGVQYIFTLQDNQTTGGLDARVQYNVYDPNRANQTTYLVGPTGSTNTTLNRFTATYSGVAMVQVVPLNNQNYGYFNIRYTTSPADRVPANVLVPAEKIRTLDLVSRDPVNIHGRNYADIHLNNGIYTITAKAYKAGGVIGNPADEIASGSISNVTVTGGVVTSDGGKVPPIILSASAIGMGSLDYEITMLDDHDDLESYIAIYEIDGETPVSSFGEDGILILDGDSLDTISDSFSLAVGRYVVEIKLFNVITGEVASFRDVIEIWDDAVTKLDFAPTGYTNPDFGIAYTGATLSATETTFGGVAIGSPTGGTGVDEANAFLHTVAVPNLQNVSVVFVPDSNSRYADISWAWNTGSLPYGVGYTKWPETDFSVKNVLWVKVRSEDEKTTLFYKFTVLTEVEADVTANGSDYQKTTELTLNFDKSIVGLTASDITITANGTGAVRGALTEESEGVYKLAVTGITQSGTIGVTIANKYAHIISPISFNVDVYYAEPVSFVSLVSDGSPMGITTKLTLTFDDEIPGLTIDDIVIESDNAEFDLGEFRHIEDGVYEIDIDAITIGGQVSVSVFKAGYEVIDQPKTVNVYTVTHGSGDITINLWINEIDGTILASEDNFTISRSGASENPVSFTAQVNSAFDNVQWSMVEYTVNPDPDGSVTINAAEYNFSNATYRLNVTVWLNGTPYSTTIRFTVIN